MSVLPGAQRILRSPYLIWLGNLVLVADTAYFVYLGYQPVPVTPKYVRGAYSLAGAGAQTAELGLFSTPDAPNRANQTLTRIVATGTLDSLTAVAPQYFKNTNAFATLVPAGTHLWAGMRCNMATTQVRTGSCGNDWGAGHVLTLAAAGALTAGGGTFAGVVPAIPALIGDTIAPVLSATLD